MISQKELHRFLSSKMSFTNNGGTEHDQYVLYDSGNVVWLPTKPTLPRHAKDLSTTVLKKTAASLGLSLKAFQVGCQCHLSAACIRLCIASHAIERGLSLYLTDPVVYEHFPELVFTTVDALVNPVQKSHKWTPAEDDVLRSAKSKTIDHLRSIDSATRILDIWMEGYNGGT